MNEHVPSEEEVRVVEERARAAQEAARRLQQIDREQTGAIRDGKRRAKRKAAKAARRRNR